MTEEKIQQLLKRKDQINERIIQAKTLQKQKQIEAEEIIDLLAAKNIHVTGDNIDEVILEQEKLLEDSLTKLESDLDESEEILRKVDM